MSPPDYSKMVREINAQLKTCRATTLDHALLFSGSGGGLTLIPWALRKKKRSKKKKSREDGDDGGDGGEEEAKAPEPPKPVTTTEAIKKLKQQEVSIGASTKVQMRRNDSALSLTGEGGAATGATDADGVSGGGSERHDNLRSGRQRWQ